VYLSVLLRVSLFLGKRALQRTLGRRIVGSVYFHPFVLGFIIQQNLLLQVLIDHLKLHRQLLISLPLFWSLEVVLGESE